MKNKINWKKTYIIGVVTGLVITALSFMKIISGYDYLIAAIITPFVTSAIYIIISINKKN